jgi:hypothetical protein
MNKQLLVAIAFIVILGGGMFLRFRNLGAQSYWMDEGYTVNAVLSGLKNGTDHFASILDSGERYACPTYCLPTMALVRIIGKTPFGYRWLAALCGTLVIAVVFVFTRALSRPPASPTPLPRPLPWQGGGFSKEPLACAPLIAALFVSFSYFQIVWSRQARWYTELELLYWLALLLFLLFLREDRRNHEEKRRGSAKEWIYLLFSIVSAFLAIVTQPIAYTLPVVMIVWYVIDAPDKKQKWMRTLIATACAAAFVATIEYAFGFRFVAGNVWRFVVLDHSPFYAEFFFRNYWVFALLVMYAFIRKRDRGLRRTLFVLVLPFLLTFAGLSYFTGLIEYRYFFHTIPGIIIVAAFGAVQVAMDVSSATLRFNNKNSYALIGSLYSGIAVLLAIFFGTGQGIIAPKPFYLLEADDPAVEGKVYYAYTPQPDWTAAYQYITAHTQGGDVIISSHPQFTRIFLEQPGYWIAFDYLGRKGRSVPISKKTERYVNAAIIHNSAEFQSLTSSTHGYFVYDYQSSDRRIDPAILQYIQENFVLVFHDEKNSYSQVWVYRF